MRRFIILSMFFTFLMTGCECASGGSVGDDYFDGGGGLTDPAAIEDLNRLQQTAPGSN